MDWRPIETAPLNVEVETKVDDANGVRNVQTLRARQSDPLRRVMWWLPDGTMYVYYNPTHWRPVTAEIQEAP